MQKLILVVASLSATLLTSSFSNAQGTGGGTIYFADNGLTYTMNSDGNNKTPLVLSDNPGNPSRALYGGHRWFLQTRQIAGQYYPNGDTRREVYAVRDDAAIEVQLSDENKARNGASDKRCTMEALLAFKRAGADGILTYCALDAGRWLREES